MSVPWQCPCCGIIWAPGMAFCHWCSPLGQIDENVRQFHDCPTFGRQVDTMFATMMRDVPTIKPEYKVPPRPDIKRREE